MKHKQTNIFVTIFIAVVFAAMFSSCATMDLDTLNKRIAAFEISYQEVLKTIILYKNENRFTADEWSEIQDRVSEVSFARGAMKAAIKIDDYDTASKNLALASNMLNILRTYAIKKEMQNAGT